MRKGVLINPSLFWYFFWKNILTCSDFAKLAGHSVAAT